MAGFLSGGRWLSAAGVLRTRRATGAIAIHGGVLRFAVQVSAPCDARAAYALELLFESIGIPALRAEPSAADLVYSPDPPSGPSPDAVWIRTDPGDDWDSEIARAGVWHGVPVLYRTLPPEDSGPDSGAILADLPYSTYALVTGAFERQQAKNRFGVPIGNGSLLDVHGLLRVPAVSLYAGALSRVLARRYGKDFQPISWWPPGKRFAIVVSHDVDTPLSQIPSSYHSRALRRELRQAQFGLALKSLFRSGRAFLKEKLGATPPPARDPNFCFEAWSQLERKLAAKSCFYVATISSADQFSAPEDVEYDFRHPAIVGALRTAQSEGWEVGLHASINSRKISGGFAKERRLLQRVLHQPVAGVRHHYWAVDPELPERTLRDHAAAGFTYDSSLGMNDIAGFRRGMARPFQPFDRERNSRLPLLELPPTLMDGGIFYKDVNGSQGDDQIRSHLACVSEHGGCAVLDWHLEQMNPANLRGAGPALSRVLLELAGNSEVFWASPLELLTWWQNRRKGLAR